MSGIKAMVVGAAAAALILGTGCRSDQPRDTQRQGELESTPSMQGTGGSGTSVNDSMNNSAIPSSDTMRGTPGQDSDVHGMGTGGSGFESTPRSSVPSSRSSTTPAPYHMGSEPQSVDKGGALPADEAQPLPLDSSDVGTGGSGQMKTQPAPSVSPDQNNQGIRTQESKSRDVKTLGNETGSRTNTTGTNISSDTNPTEPRNEANSIVPGQRKNQ